MEMDTKEVSSQEARSLPLLELTADIGEAERKSSLTLMGKIISKTVIKTATVKMITKRIWFIQEPAQVDQLGTNIFIFSFKRVTHRTRGDHGQSMGLI